MSHHHAFGVLLIHTDLINICVHTSGELRAWVGGVHDELFPTIQNY